MTVKEFRKLLRNAPESAIVLFSHEAGIFELDPGIVSQKECVRSENGEWIVNNDENTKGKTAVVVG